MTKNNILVTGATGFIGFNLVLRLLKEKKKVRALVRKGSKLNKLKKLNLEIVYGSLEDINSLKRATKNIKKVFHCASLLGSPKITLRKILKVNVKGTENLLKACIANKVKRFIYFSSVAAMGDAGLNANEKTECKPTTFYDISKYKAELVVKEYSKKIGVIIIRPTTVYGPGEIRNKAKLFQLIKKKRFVIIGNGKNLISLVYIDNLIDVVILAANKKNAIWRVYIVSDKRSYTINEFIETIAKVENVKTPWHIPLWIAKLLAFFLETLSRITGTTPILYKERIKNLTKNSSFDISKAEKELNYKPKISLEQGIRKTADWYKKQNIIK